MTTQSYLERFKNNIDVIEYCGGQVGGYPGAIRTKLDELGYNPDTPTPAEYDEAYNIVKEEHIATCFLTGADRQQYGQLIRDYENSFIEGNDRFPKTLTDAYNLLVKYKQNPKLKSVDIISDGANFMNSGSTEEETDGSTFAQKSVNKSKVKCNKCDRMGHYANECTATTHLDGTSLFIHGDFSQSSFHFYQVGECVDDTHDNNIYNTEETSDKLTKSSYCYAQPNTSQIPNSWILLDNGSTIDVFMNDKLLNNIHKTNTRMNIHCNAGTASTNLMGELRGYGDVWFAPNGVANILSLSNLAKKFRITYDSATDDGFIVHKPDGVNQHFVQSPHGLFYLDTEKSQANSTLLINTVKNNENRFTKRDVLRARTARKLQNVIGHPPLRKYVEILKYNLIPNCTITIQDVINAELILGPNLASLKGKTPRTAPAPVSVHQIDLPPDLLTLYQKVTLSGDIMFLNKVPFLVTISHKLKFSTAEALTNRKQKTIFTGVRHVVDIYKKRGFQVETILMDCEFECLRADLLGLNITLNTTANDEHSPVIERFIRTLKDGVRSVYTVLPFKKIPTLMLTDLVYNIIFWKNAFPHKENVDNRLSPRSIVTGMHLDFVTTCQLEYGSYVQTHEDHDNTLQERTAGAIALRPMGNAQGGWYFMSLRTGRRLRRFQWTPLPMPQEVIDRVHIMARRNQAQRDIIFYYRDGLTPINDIANDEYDDALAGVNNQNNDDDPDDDTYLPDEDPDADDTDNENSDDEDYDSDDDSHYERFARHKRSEDTQPNDSITEWVRELEQEEANQHEPQPDTITSNPNVEPIYHNIDTAGVSPDEHPSNETEGVSPSSATEQNDVSNDHLSHAAATVQNDVSNDHLSHADFDRKMNEMYGQRTREGLRDRKARDYSHLFHVTGTTKCTAPQSFSHVRDMYGIDDPIMEGLVASQYTVEKGIKLWGDRSVDAVDIELRQLHEREVGEPKMRSELSPAIRKLALRYLMFLKEKRSGQIKGRGCADGRSQRIYTKKEDASSPTAHIESLIITCIIDSMEYRDVATVDIPGAFMQANIDDETYVKIQGAMCDIFVKIDPERYANFVCTEQGRNTIYLKLKKALYGTIRAARLFYDQLIDTLKSWGFSLNDYDRCVANKDINGHQCTIVWHVDDLKISHVDPDVVTDIINKLNDRYRKLKKLVATRGKIHDFLGITIDYTQEGKVSMSMKKYIQEIIDEAPDDFSGTAPTPAANHLFEIETRTENMKLLSAEQKQTFHHITAQLLFLSKRTRPDIQTAIAFLTTRVSRPDIHDWKKLGRVIKYLRGSKDLDMTLESDSLNVVKWWADGAFAVHSDCKSHTGAVMSLGKGAAYSTSTKQKLNTKSSTEAELVAVDDVMAQVIWTRNFIKSQGYDTGPSVMHQDNQSAILLEENGMESSSKRTRHINIRYFFVKDRVDSNEIKINIVQPRK